MSSSSRDFDFLETDDFAAVDGFDDFGLGFDFDFGLDFDDDSSSCSASESPVDRFALEDEDERDAGGSLGRRRLSSCSSSSDEEFAGSTGFLCMIAQHCRTHTGIMNARDQRNECVLKQLDALRNEETMICRNCVGSLKQS